MIAYFHVEDTVVRAPARSCYELALGLRRYGEWWSGRCGALGPEGTGRVGSRVELSSGALHWVVDVQRLDPYRRIELLCVDGDLRGPLWWEFDERVEKGAGDERSRTGEWNSARAPSLALRRGQRSPRGRDPLTRVRFALRGVQAASPRAEQVLGSDRGLRRFGAAVQSDVLAGMRRVVEAPAADVSGGDLFAALHSQRAVRRFRPDPISDAILAEIVAAATRAPSARNTQPWVFVAVRDAALKREVRGYYLTAWRRAQEFTARADADADIKHRPDYAAMMRSVDTLAEHLDQAPVLLLCGLDTRQLGPMADAHGTILAPQSAYASIFPAVQNLMLAARGLGIGSTLTTVFAGVEAELRRVVGLPDHVHIAALVPLGYPLRPFRVTTRKPLREVAFLDRWGKPLPE
jgi:nitroreductase